MARPFGVSESLDQEARDQVRAAGRRDAAARNRQVAWVERTAFRAIHSIYRVHWLAALMRGALNAVVPDSPREVRIAGGPLRGARIVVNLRAGKYWWLGTYEPWVQDLLVEAIRPGMRVWDVGAYFGYHTLLMRRLAGPRCVVALEPDAQNRAHLERHLVLNDARDVRVLPVAAGAEPRRGSVRKRRVPSGNEVIPSDQNGDVDIVTLDSLVDQHGPPALVKIDVEGAEADVLTGASRLIEHIKPTWIIELHTTDATPFARLREAGYRIEMVGREVDAMSSDLPGGPVHLVARPQSP